MKKFFAVIFSGLAITALVAAKPQTDVQPVNPIQVRGGLPHVFEKLKKHKPLVIAYLGGSITEAPGYRIQTESYFKSAYPKSEITAVNAGVGGTGSYLGVFRVGQDVLVHKPDLVFVEFAVNDAKGDSLKTCNAIEGIIRQIKRANPKTDICFLYTIYEPMIAEYNAGVAPSSVRYIDRIAAYYNFPSINLSTAVLAKLKQGDLIFKADKSAPANGKLIFTNDGTHPTPEGHEVYTATIINAWKQMQNIKGDNKDLPQLLYPGALQYTTMVSPSTGKQTGNWKSGSELPELKSFLKSFPDLIWTDNPNDKLTINFEGREIGFGDVVGPSASGAIITVDGIPMKRRLFDEYCMYYRRSFFFIDGLSDGPHTLTIQLDPTPIDKLNMLRPGNRGDLSRYNRNELFIGNIMLSKKH